MRDSPIRGRGSQSQSRCCFRSARCARANAKSRHAPRDALPPPGETPRHLLPPHNARKPWRRGRKAARWPQRRNACLCNAIRACQSPRHRGAHHDWGWGRRGYEASYKPRSRLILSQAALICATCSVARLTNSCGTPREAKLSGWFSRISLRQARRTSSSLACRVRPSIE